MITQSTKLDDIHYNPKEINRMAEGSSHCKTRLLGEDSLPFVVIKPIGLQTDGEHQMEILHHISFFNLQTLF